MGNATFVLGVRREVSLRPALNVSFTGEIQRTDAGLLQEEAKGPDAENTGASSGICLAFVCGKEKHMGAPT